MDQQSAESLKAQFDRDGFVIMRNFFDQDTVDEICNRAETALAEMNKGRKRTDQFSNVTKGLDRRDDFFKDLLHNGPQVAILEMLMGKKPEGTTASFFTKDKNSQEVHPHSDALEGGVVWVAIDPTDQDNGCLQFLRGSYKRQEEFKHLSAASPTDLSEHPDLAAAAMNPGDIVFFYPTTVHWSGPCLDGRIRRGFNCFYVGDPWKGYSKEQLMAMKKNAVKKTESAES